MAVWALVTVGVQSNAWRAGSDTGDWYEPGTINIIVLTDAVFKQNGFTARRPILPRLQERGLGAWETVAGRPLAPDAVFNADDRTPGTLKMALDAVLTGVGIRLPAEEKQ